MIPTRSSGLMRHAPTAVEVAPYLELGLAAAGEDDSEALVLLLASQGFWDFGFGVDPDDESGQTRRGSGRARAGDRARGWSAPTSSCSRSTRSARA